MSDPETACRSVITSVLASSPPDAGSATLTQPEDGNSWFGGDGIHAKSNRYL